MTARGAQYLADGICWEAVTHDGQPGWMAADYLVPVNGEADDDADPCADAESADDSEEATTTEEPRVLPAPPPGGWTQGVAGTSDIEALVAAQTFDVQSVWALDLATQGFQSYIPGAPAFVNNPGVSSLRPDSVVMMLRRGERPDELPGAPVAGDEAPLVAANVLPSPPEGGFTLGVSGTNDPMVLAASQPFEVRLIAMLDVPSPDLADLHPGSSRLRAVPDARPAAARLDRLAARRRGAGPGADGHARTRADSHARADGHARADRDAGGDHRRGKDHLLLLQPGDNFGRHRRRWRVV